MGGICDSRFGLSKRWMREDNEALARLSESEDGRAFLYRLLVECGVFEPNVECDLAKIAHCEGRRSIGLWVLNMLERAERNLGAKVLAGVVLRQNDRAMEMEAIRNVGRDEG